jgi:predicted transcriptional regulator
MKVQSKNMTLLNILDATSHGHELFTFIANDVKSFGLSKKQYYDRLSRLTKMHLIKRGNEKWVLTTFGEVIYELHIKLLNAINDSQVFKASEYRPVDD